MTNGNQIYDNYKMHRWKSESWQSRNWSYDLCNNKWFFESWILLHGDIRTGPVLGYWVVFIKFYTGKLDVKERLTGSRAKLFLIKLENFVFIYWLIVFFQVGLKRLILKILVGEKNIHSYSKLILRFLSFIRTMFFGSAWEKTEITSDN